jgi:hypothetical protein
MADDARSFRVIYEQDPSDDSWLVRVEGIDGCHTYGRTNSKPPSTSKKPSPPGSTRSQASSL